MQRLTLSTGVLAALGIVYVVWGSTYLAIRVGLETLPPFLMVGARFLVAGALLYAVAVRRGDVVGDRPRWPQWRATLVVGGLLLVGGNGLVVWGEQTVPSGIAALLVATLPLWMALFGRVAFGTRLRATAVVGLVVGFGGVALLVRPTGASWIDPVGTAVILCAPVCWAIGSLWSGRLPLPSRPFVTTGMEMLWAGGILTLVGLVGGEAGRLDLAAVSGRSWAALAYLVVFGSLIAFSAYVWLLREAPPAILSTYAYVNPVVAVALGWAVLAEPVTATTLAAGAVIVLAVALIVSAGRNRPACPGSRIPRQPRTTGQRTATGRQQHRRQERSHRLTHQESSRALNLLTGDGRTWTLAHAWPGRRFQGRADDRRTSEPET